MRNNQNFRVSTNEIILDDQIIEHINEVKKNRVQVSYSSKIIGKTTKKGVKNSASNFIVSKTRYCYKLHLHAPALHITFPAFSSIMSLVLS